MKLLLDTHIWLWALLEPARLIPAVAEALRKPTNEIWLSPISVWECLVLAESCIYFHSSGGGSVTDCVLSDTDGSYNAYAIYLSTGSNPLLTGTSFYGYAIPTKYE